MKHKLLFTALIIVAILAGGYWGGKAYLGDKAKKEITEEFENSP